MINCLAKSQFGGSWAFLSFYTAQVMSNLLDILGSFCTVLLKVSQPYTGGSHINYLNVLTVISFEYSFILKYDLISTSSSCDVISSCCGPQRASLLSEGALHRFQRFPWLLESTKERTTEQCFQP